MRPAGLCGTFLLEDRFADQFGLTVQTKIGKLVIRNLNFLLNPINDLLKRAIVQLGECFQQSSVKASSLGLGIAVRPLSNWWLEGRIRVLVSSLHDPVVE